MTYKDFNDKLYRLGEARKQNAERRRRLRRTGKAERPNFLYNLPPNIKGLGKSISNDIDNDT